MVQRLYYTGGLRTLTRPLPRKRGPSPAFDCRQSRIVPLTSRIRHVRPPISFRQPPLPVDIRPDPGPPGLLPHSGGRKRYFCSNYVWQSRGRLAEFRGPWRTEIVDRVVFKVTFEVILTGRNIAVHGCVHVIEMFVGQNRPSNCLSE